MKPSPFTLPPAPAQLALTTARLTLRPLTEADLPAMVAYRGDPAVCRFLPFEPQSADDIRARIGHVFGSTTLEGERGALALALVRREDGALLGDVALFHLDRDSGSAEIGWVIRPDVAGRGYATEAVTALLEAAFTIYGLRRVTATIVADNAPSVSLAERVGMRREARFVEVVWSEGRWADLLQYAVLARERRAASSPE